MGLPTGSRRYLTSREGVGVLRVRVGDEPIIDALAYGESTEINGVRVSLHPAGHILGSSQVRVEHRGSVWVVSGDYKVGPDATCSPLRTSVMSCLHYRIDLRPVEHEEGSEPRDGKESDLGRERPSRIITSPEAGHGG